MGERLKNHNWTVNQDRLSGSYSFEAASLTVLMDLRDELQALNRIIGCHRFIAIPSTLRSIERQLKLQRRCAAHPRYTGKLKPRVNCRGCHRLHKEVWK